MDDYVKSNYDSSIRKKTKRIGFKFKKKKGIIPFIRNKKSSWDFILVQLTNSSSLMSYYFKLMAFILL
jgi:hypothetical protein